MDALTGFTGFVGSNLMAQHAFGARFNSTDLNLIESQSFGTLVVASAPGAMWQANAAPEADRAGLLRQLGYLRKARAERAVLVSTVSVYRDPSSGPDETSTDYEKLTPYGANRREFEAEFCACFPRHLIVRLPALYGSGLKKNFLFDLMNPVPTFLKFEVWETLRAGLARRDRQLLERAFIRVGEARIWRFDREGVGRGEPYSRISGILGAAGLSALSFTHADSRYQFYGVSRLWNDIEHALKEGLSLLNCTTQPLTADEVHRAVTGEAMVHREAERVTQDIKSVHSNLWGRNDGYLIGRDEVLEGILSFMARNGS